MAELTHLTRPHARWWCRMRRCVYCGVEQFEWPRSFSQEFFEEHVCPDARGHLYVDDPRVAAMVDGG